MGIDEEILEGINFLKECEKRISAGETRKSHQRRLEENWFEKYAPNDKIGLDIGARLDPLNKTFRRWDMLFGDGDAVDLEGIDNDTFYTVYASHVLEHIEDPVKAVKRWYDVVKPGGHLIIVVPHRDLYEKKKNLPSRWNHDHKTFWLPESDEPPCTRSLKGVVLEAVPNAQIEVLRVLDRGYVKSPFFDPPIGEFSIEIIIKKGD